MGAYKSGDEEAEGNREVDVASPAQWLSEERPFGIFQIGSPFVAR